MLLDYLFRCYLCEAIGNDDRRCNARWVVQVVRSNLTHFDINIYVN